MASLNLHEFNWDEDRIASFWDAYSVLHPQGDSYFSAQAGPQLLRYVKKLGVTEGSALDFGCGPGYFLRLLDADGFSWAGLDFSPRSVEAAQKNLEGSRAQGRIQLVQSLPSPFPDASFETVFLLEALEHLLPYQVAETLDEIRRLLAPDGLLVITVPFRENLRVAGVFCPECGAIFHPIQHMSSWDGPSMTRLLEHHGFLVAHSAAVDLSPSPTALSDRLLSWWRRVRARSPLPPGSNLVTVARKSD